MSGRPPSSPLLPALAAQVLGALPALAALVLVPGLAEIPLLPALAQGACAAIVSRLQRAPAWWIPIHLGFLPLAVLAVRLPVPPAAWLGGFLVLLLVFWRTDRSRVPLYLSHRIVAECVAGLLPPGGGQVADLGCGEGGFLANLSRLRPDCSFLGVEHAPLPWLVARWRTRDLPNVVIRYGDFWNLDLGPFAAVYAFLSPVPMARLGEKAAREMGHGALLVSNSFPIPDLAAEDEIQLADPRRSRLYLYRPGA